MSPPVDRKSPIVTALLEEAPYIDDGGFAARVVGALPPRRRQSALVYATTPLAGAAGCALAFLFHSHTPAPPHSPGVSALALLFAMLMSFALLAWATTAEE